MANKKGKGKVDPNAKLENVKYNTMPIEEKSRKDWKKIAKGAIKENIKLREDLLNMCNKINDLMTKVTTKHGM